MLKENTILITGGASGVGLELAKRLIEQNNTVLLCGRSEEKLKNAAKLLPVHTMVCDISEKEGCTQLLDWVQKQYPSCNILINNAAVAHTTLFVEDPEAAAKAELEFQTNVLAPIRLTQLFLPLLMRNKNPQIVNVTTGLVYAPKASYPFYNATKAALHSFTQVLRMQTQASALKVVEALLPAVDTPWHKGNVPKIAISVEKAVTELLYKLNKGQEEIKVGGVPLLYFISRLSPSLASRIINGEAI